MKLIDDYSEYKTFAATFRKNATPTRTNCYFFPKTVCALIDKRKLYVNALGRESNAFFEYCEDFYRMYYFLKDNDTVLVKSDKPVVIELPCNRFSDIENSVCFWKQHGFQSIRKSARLALSSENIIWHPSVHTVKAACLSESVQMQELLVNSFNKYCDFIPTYEELREAIKAQQILSVTIDGRVLGMLHFETTNNNSVLWHIAVHPESRGLHIGESLLSTWMNLYKCENFTYSLWMDMDNAKAKAMYEKFGFVEEGRYAIEMLGNICYNQSFE